jgi:4-hydroxyphenylpyruvate dioxygenase
MQFDNPMGTDGFEFVEFATLDANQLGRDFVNMGFTKVAKHRSKNIFLYRQGEINFIINAEPNSQAEAFAKGHGDAACAMGFRVKDANKAFARAIELGAEPFKQKIGIGELEIPAIYGIGGSIIYFIDRYGKQTVYDTDFIFEPNIDKHPFGVGLTYIDHLTHNVRRGGMNIWATYYEKFFNFREIRYFDIQGEKTGLLSRAMTSPCGKIRIPINESSDDKSQIEEFITEFKGEGIQHIALGTDDIYKTVEQMRKSNIEFLATPDTYFAMIIDRVPWHQEDLARLQKNKILLDGTPTPEGGLLLQIFTQTMLGPVFFEIIQRKGNDGFGEGNFRALFLAMERDQMERGVL